MVSAEMSLCWAGAGYCSQEVVALKTYRRSAELGKKAMQTFAICSFMLDGLFLRTAVFGSSKRLTGAD
jgi:hypothetical protein